MCLHICPELESQNRELRAAADAAAADTREVSGLVEQHRALEAAHKELQASGWLRTPCALHSTLRLPRLGAPAWTVAHGVRGVPAGPDGCAGRAAGGGAGRGRRGG